MLQLFPEACVFHLGLYRDKVGSTYAKRLPILTSAKSSFTPTEYYSKLPTDFNKHCDTVYLLDPVVATGATACAAVNMLQGRDTLAACRRRLKLSFAPDAGLPIANIKLLCVVASMPGLQQIMRECPGLSIFVAAVDQELNEQGYISPGVGDR